MGVDFDELELRLMREFLESASATEWLVTALATNYDGKSELIAWMAAHPKLDRATISRCLPNSLVDVLGLKIPEQSPG